MRQKGSLSETKGEGSETKREGSETKGESQILYNNIRGDGDC